MCHLLFLPPPISPTFSAGHMTPTHRDYASNTDTAETAVVGTNNSCADLWMGGYSLRYPIQSAARTEHRNSLL